MTNDLTKRTSPTKPERQQPTDAASRLKHELMNDRLGRMLGEDGEKPGVAGTPRVILALADHGHSPGWDRAKVLQRQLFAAAAGRFAHRAARETPAVSVFCGVLTCRAGHGAP